MPTSDEQPEQRSSRLLRLLAGRVLAQELGVVALREGQRAHARLDLARHAARGRGRGRCR